MEAPEQGGMVYVWTTWMVTCLRKLKFGSGIDREIVDGLVFVVVFRVAGSETKEWQPVSLFM